MIVQGGAHETTVSGKRYRVVCDRLLELQAGEELKVPWSVQRR